MKYISFAYYALAMITTQPLASNITNHDDEMIKSLIFLRNIKLQAMVSADVLADHECEQCLVTLAPDQDEQDLDDNLLTSQSRKKSTVLSLKKLLWKLCHLHK